MADYYPLLSRAVAGLPDNTPETRRAIYDRARVVLLQQLRAVDPPLSEADIEREQIALDDVIARIENEYAPPLYDDPLEPRFDEAVGATAGYDDDRDPYRSGGGYGEIDRYGPGDDQSAEPPGMPGGYGALPRGEDERPARPRLSPSRGARDGGERRRTLIVAGVLALAIAAIAGTALWLRQEAPAPVPDQAQTEPGETPTEGEAKFNDRIGGPPSDQAPPAQPQPQPPQQATPPGGAVAVSQRAILYEETGDANQAPRATGGRAVWRLDTVNPGEGQPLETVVRAEVAVPEAGFTLNLTFRRNTDATLPASHTVEMTFEETDPQRAVREVGVPQLKTDEGARGTPLAGLPVPVTSNFFLVGLSNLASDVERNTELLRSRSWMDIPLRYASGRRAVLAFEKGLSGEQALEAALRVWAGQQ
ncbi:hypothetical protein Ga0061061_101413 [Chelatococcus sambhunathii]|uniref:Uncharacterized protein n=2 Tax=Chelatococcus TaxID=28209 RepID=A0AAC9JVX3_9HYPH|nr:MULTISPECIES: hypothetical protein [Chelatococcus]APF38222.1 hypothetical protein BOQ54_13560 [Chelatococcus daeguensis]CUA84486.1 hypothetical protein Ga0061061_101413 [Chelatococcus sambhunathii]